MNINKFLLTIIVTAFYVISICSFAKILGGEIKFAESKQAAQQKNITKALKNINKAISKNPKEPRYYYERAKYLIIQNEPSKALENLNIAENLNENNLVSLKNMIPIYSFLPKEQAQDYYNRLKQKYPNDTGVLVQIAKYEKSLGLNEGYKETIKMINDLRPDLTEWAL